MQVSEPDARNDDHLDPDVTLRIQNRLSKGTRKVYERARGIYATWCERNHRRHLPATPATLLSYVDHLTDLKWAPTTIGIHIAAITSWHEESGHPRPDPRRAHLLLRAYRHQRAREGYRPRRVDPLTVEHLRAIVAACGSGSIAADRDRAMMLLGFALMARSSIMPRLDLSDLRSSRAGLEVHVRYDKRQPTGRTVAVPRLEVGDPLCVAAAVDAWVGDLAAHHIRSGALLRPVSQNGRPLERALSQSGVATVFHRIVGRAGLDTTALDLTPHSLRAGAASASYDAGADPVDIAAQGGWITGSAALWTYIRGRDRWTNNPIHKALTQGGPR